MNCTKNKLNSLKKIPLDQFCVDRLGYTVCREKDCKTWRCLVSPFGLKIVVNSRPSASGYYYYFCPQDDNLEGSVIDLLMSLHGFSSIKDILKEFCSSSLPKYEPRPYVPLVCKDATQTVKALYERYLKYDCFAVKCNYLHRRGISDKITKDYQIDVAEKHLLLPLYLLNGSRWEVATAINFFFDRNNERKRLFLKGFPKRGSFSLLRYKKKPLDNFNSLIIFESPIDALSYAQLFPAAEKAILVSFCGGFGKSFVHQLKLMIKRLCIQDVKLCLDNDTAGHTFEQSLRKQLKEVNLDSHFPNKKDWNDEINKI